MTDEEAQEMLKELSKHFKEPVLPISKYCGALRTWQRCVYESYQEEKEAGEAHPCFQHLVSSMEDVELAINKSSLLWRLIYNREDLRTKKCPVHKGKWSGVPSPESDCEHGCDLTGWVPDSFVPSKPGDPCRHRWRSIEVKTKNIVCYHCQEFLGTK